MCRLEDGFVDRDKSEKKNCPKRREINTRLFKLQAPVRRQESCSSKASTSVSFRDFGTIHLVAHGTPTSGPCTGILEEEVQEYI